MSVSEIGRVLSVRSMVKIRALQMNEFARPRSVEGSSVFQPPETTV